jgi:NMD protein affecting ribosome stability and mRNA decay
METSTAADRLITVRTMSETTRIHRLRPHRHRPVTTHVVVQRAGVPYELERRVCETCGRELAERSLKRAAA